ncbi:hypothetical protein BT63DRAFT_478180 [Microthyrium microscopicum]|uniref:Uncharacterized protein n=1 Tax=Microthyrium microscopicum TaxID=703497 RepID=A0A6A6UCH6_9PEZI|nr:hypothetical protein BT63DRAFT_478180 [Microthyrium microscopicum]
MSVAASIIDLLAMAMTSCCGDQAGRCDVHRPVQPLAPTALTCENYKYRKNPEHHLLNVPTEIRLLICENLSLASRCALALTCKGLKDELSLEFWPSLDTNHTEMDMFLNMLRKDIPDTFVCGGWDGCHQLEYAPYTLSVDGPSLGAYPSTPVHGRDLAFDNFYHAPATHIQRWKEDQICPEYFYCSTTLTFHAGDSQYLGSVKYFINEFEGRNYLFRKYRLPIVEGKPITIVSNAGSNSPVGIEMCKHNKLKWLMKRALPPVFLNGPAFPNGTLACWTGRTLMQDSFIVLDRSLGIFGATRKVHTYECDCGAFAEIKDVENIEDTHAECVFATPLKESMDSQ